MADAEYFTHQTGKTAAKAGAVLVVRNGNDLFRVNVIRDDDRGYRIRVPFRFSRTEGTPVPSRDAPADAFGKTVVTCEDILQPFLFHQRKRRL